MNANKHKSLGGLSHGVERTNIKNGITKKCAKLQYWKDRMLIEIKGYIKLDEHQFEEYMEYDGMNEDKINPNGKHQCLWM